MVFSNDPIIMHAKKITFGICGTLIHTSVTTYCGQHTCIELRLICIIIHFIIAQS